jgi:hypothetical protein
MRVLRAGSVAGTLAAIALIAAIISSGGTVADAASGHNRLSHGMSHAYDVAGTVTYSGHGNDALIAGTTVPPGPDGGCSASTSHLKTTDSYSLSGHYSGQLGTPEPHPRVSAKLLGLYGTSGCNNTGQAGIALACTATPMISGFEGGEVSGDVVKLSISTLIESGTERRVNGEPCFDAEGSSVPVVPNNDSLEVGGTFTVALSQIEKTRTVSVTLDSQKAVNCVGGELALPAHATVCVDPSNAKNARCDVLDAPAGGSASCTITNHWVETITFHLSQVCTMRDAVREAEEPLAPACN